MIWFPEGELCGEVCKAYRKETYWFWRRDVLLQAEERGLLRITGDRAGTFWAGRFEDNVEVLAKRLEDLLAEETDWMGPVHAPFSEGAVGGPQGVAGMRLGAPPHLLRHHGG